MAISQPWWAQKPLLGGRTVEPVPNVFRGVRDGRRGWDLRNSDQPPRWAGSSLLELVDASLQDRWEKEINISPVEACLSLIKEQDTHPCTENYSAKLRSTEYSGEQSRGERQNKRE